MVRYDEHVKTLKDISYDSDNKEYVTDSLIEVVDFDEYQETYLKSIDSKYKKPCFVDALCTLNGDWCFIEFKNGRIDSRQIDEKVVNSVIVVMVKEDIKPSGLKKHSKLIVVYNAEHEQNTTNHFINMERVLLRKRRDILF